MTDSDETCTQGHIRRKSLGISQRLSGSVNAVALEVAVSVLGPKQGTAPRTGPKQWE